MASTAERECEGAALWFPVIRADDAAKPTSGCEEDPVVRDRSWGFWTEQKPQPLADYLPEPSVPLDPPRRPDHARPERASTAPKPGPRP